VTITVTDSDGIAAGSVSLHFDPPDPVGAVAPEQAKPMTHTSGDGYRADLSVPATWGTGEMPAWVTAKDTKGKSGKSSTIRINIKC
jgi:hypothetical protein